MFVSDLNPVMKVEAVFTDMLEPYPAEITQNEVRYIICMNLNLDWVVLVWFDSVRFALNFSTKTVLR